MVGRGVRDLRKQLGPAREVHVMVSLLLLLLLMLVVLMLLLLLMVHVRGLVGKKSACRGGWQRRERRCWCDRHRYKSRRFPCGKRPAILKVHQARIAARHHQLVDAGVAVPAPARMVLAALTARIESQSIEHGLGTATLSRPLGSKK